MDSKKQDKNQQSKAAENNFPIHGGLIQEVAIGPLLAEQQLIETQVKKG